MTRRQENILTMYVAVLKLMLTYQTNWSNIPLIAQKIEELKTQIKAIREALQIQEKIYKGKTLDKKNLRELISKRAASMTKIIAAFATLTNNMALKEKVNYTKSELLRVADNIFIERLDIIIAEAYENASDIANSGPFPTTAIDELDLITNDYAEQTSVTRTAIITKKSATSNLRVLFKETSYMLKNILDGAMEFLEDKPIYKKYHDARIIIDYRRGRRNNNNNTPPPIELDNNTDE